MEKIVLMIFYNVGKMGSGSCRQMAPATRNALVSKRFVRNPQFCARRVCERLFYQCVFVSIHKMAFNGDGPHNKRQRTDAETSNHRVRYLNFHIERRTANVSPDAPDYRSV